MSDRSVTLLKTNCRITSTIFLTSKKLRPRQVFALPSMSIHSAGPAHKAASRTGHSDYQEPVIGTKSQQSPLISPALCVDCLSTSAAVGSRTEDKEHSFTLDLTAPREGNSCTVQRGNSVTPSAAPCGGPAQVSFWAASSATGMWRVALKRVNFDQINVSATLIPVFMLDLQCSHQSLGFHHAQLTGAMTMS